MKNSAGLTAIISFVLLIACSQKRTDDPKELEKVISGYFEAIKNKDLAGMNALTTADFMLFEGGKAWNNDSLYYYIKSNPPFKPNWTFDFKRITIDESTASVVYHNHGVFILDTLRQEMDWLESANFVKENGTWKMSLLHSTEMR